MKKVQSNESNTIQKKEFSARSIIWGIIIGVIMLALSIYLLAAVGMDMNVSVVASALGVMLMPLIGGATNKKEVNIMQTTASAVAYGSLGLVSCYVAAMLFGYEFKLSLIVIILLLANIIGICFVTILRKQVVEDPSLPFPQSVMCKTAIDNTGMLTGRDTKMLIIFVVIGLLLSFFQQIMHIIPLTFSITQYLPDNMVMGITLMPMLLGLGYVMGPKISSILLIATVCSNMVLAPIGAKLGWYPDVKTTYSDMQNFNISIVVGMTLIASIVPIIKQRKAFINAFNFKNIKFSGKNSAPIKLITMILIVSVLGLSLFLNLALKANFFLMLLFVILGIFISLIAVRMQAESGLSAALALNIFYMFAAYYVTHDPIATLILLFAEFSIMMLAQNTMTDLKTGYLLDSTPRKQVWAQFIGIIPGIIAGALFFYGFIRSYGINSETISYPMGKVFYSIVAGMSGGGMKDVFNSWRFIIGGAVGLILTLFGLPAGAIALTLYLRPEVIVCISLGGIVRGILNKKVGKDRAERYNNAATGLVVGDALIAVVVVILTLAMSK